MKRANALVYVKNDTLVPLWCRPAGSDEQDVYSSSWSLLVREVIQAKKKKQKLTWVVPCDQGPDKSETPRQVVIRVDYNVLLFNLLELVSNLDGNGLVDFRSDTFSSPGRISRDARFVKRNRFLGE
jgi:hypothetical protein